MIVDKLFQLMAEKRASDIYVSAGAPIHIKIEGTTVPINAQVMDPPLIQRMAYEMMAPEQIERFEQSKEMNLSFGRSEVGNFRVNVFWQRGSIAIVVRFIQGNIPAIDSLGLPPVLSELIMEKRGLILVVGATGSGKSTTMASMLDHRNINRAGHILTVEDPIEYLFRHKKSVVNQREIGMDTGSWENALKNAMRQAPDCILIGEIRDRETMQAALAYAQTGHLCLATLHANNAYHAMNRIINFFAIENRPAAVPRPFGQPEGDHFAAPGEEARRNALACGRNPAQYAAHPGADRARRDQLDQGGDGTSRWPPARRPSSRTCSASIAKMSSRSTKHSPMPTRRPTCPG